MKITLLDNDRAAVGLAVEDALGGAETFDAAVAFVKRSGLEAAPSLRGFARSNRVRVLAGTDFSLTEVEAVDELSRSGAESRVFIEGFARSSPPPSARAFHPKVYLACGARRVVAIVGSANLTRGGLETNREACLRVEGDPEEPILAETARFFEGLWTNPYAVPVDDRFREQYLRMEEARRRADRAGDEDEGARHARRILRAHLTSLVTGGRGPGREGPRCWILVTSLPNFEVCRERQWWGDVEENRIGKLRDGDAVVFYIKREKRLGGLALVRGLPFPIDKSPWEEDRYTWAIRVDFLLTPGRTIDVEGLVPALSFVRNKRVWGTHLQGFMRSVPFRDFEIMRNALAAATIGEALPRVAEA